MRATELQLIDLPNGNSEFSARVSVEHPRPHTRRLFFRGPRGCFGDAPPGDILLAALLVPAMFLHEEIEIEGEISREVYEAAYERLAPRFLAWHPKYLKAAPLRGARIVEPRVAAAGGVGCMFSGGADSTFSLLRRLDEVTHLVFIGGFELSWEREDLRREALAHLSGLAREVDREVIVLTSNLRDLADDLGTWSVELGRRMPGFNMVFYFGCMLVAFNLCLRGVLGRAIIPSSWSEANDVTWGSHPEIEPNWSTPLLAVELDGVDTPRIDKIAWLYANHPDKFRHLRVCARAPRGGVINCGVCTKCRRTMMEMRVAGVPAPAMTMFGAPLDLEQVRRSFFGGDGGVTEEVLERARANGDRELARALEIYLGRRFYLPRVIEGWRLVLKRRRKERRRARRKARHNAGVDA